MHLVVGLGNPGPKYQGNRHNIGFMAVDAIVRRHGFSAWRKRFQGEVSEGTLGGEKVLVLKPMTYMNESGRSVGEAVRFYDIDPAQVIVFYDELDLDPGKVRVKLGGGAAGHNGIRSMISHVGPHFVRVRLGIGHPGDKRLVQPHVLSDFAKADRTWLEPLIDAVADNIPLLVKGEEGTFQNRVHLAVNPSPEKPLKKVEN
ncbi:MAG: aminoacyl-tRNA hydrolase [Alphaproteobacteria bacterium]|nr:aminoacyl-tRNA hydrolase [Alphaproteobacteria bacterium]